MTQKLVSQERVKSDLLKLLPNLKSQKLNLLVTAPAGYGKTTFVLWALNQLKLEYNYNIGDDYMINTKEINVMDEAHEIKGIEKLYLDIDTSGGFIFITNRLTFPVAFYTRVYKIEFDEYTEEDIAEIIKMYFPKASKELRLRMANTFLLNPRITHKDCNILRIYIGAYARDKEIAKILDEHGYKEYEPDTQKYIDYLKTVGHASINTITKAIGLPREYIEDYIEPYLFKNDIVRITNRGRVLNKEV